MMNGMIFTALSVGFSTGEMLAGSQIPNEAVAREIIVMGKRIDRSLLGTTSGGFALDDGAFNAHTVLTASEGPRQIVSRPRCTGAATQHRNHRHGEAAEESLSDAAIPVSVLNGRAVLDGGITTLDRLAERFPALSIQPNSTGNLLFIRGVGNFTLLPNSDPAVGWNYDGVFVARPIGTNGESL